MSSISKVSCCGGDIIHLVSVTSWNRGCGQFHKRHWMTSGQLAALFPISMGSWQPGSMVGPFPKYCDMCVSVMPTCLIVSCGKWLFDVCNALLNSLLGKWDFSWLTTVWNLTFGFWSISWCLFILPDYMVVLTFMEIITVLVLLYCCPFPVTLHVVCTIFSCIMNVCIYNYYAYYQFLLCGMCYI